ncbi:hypothetical protein LTR78_000593 [Recurvomyces mirabilis]|uniref:Peptidase M12A domain-containing protein n=1 Tax=Recurvomyces mirabilis TaxID=574656 RepID=A0AAE0WYJ9_9PEZI|nr:hypothetical protein LTR78_000593 [Recurvomyces mirabilis]KAK5162247.1 hypothetical protein LTS14_000594 [Recurvomyces mirabilis]
MFIPDFSCHPPAEKVEEEKVDIRCLCQKPADGETVGRTTVRISLAKSSTGAAESEEVESGPSKGVRVRSDTAGDRSAESDYGTGSEDEDEKTATCPDRSFSTYGFDSYHTDAIDPHRIIIADTREAGVKSQHLHNCQVSSLVHEMGHTMGLLHEHQRPDRDHFMKVDCTKLKSYKEAETLVMQPEYARDWEDEPELHERMARVCSESGPARKYLPMAATMIKCRPSATNDPKGWVLDPDLFNFGSIMIYGSTNLGEDSDVTRPPMVRKFPSGYRTKATVESGDGAKVILDEHFFEGGSARVVAQKDAAAALTPADMWKPMHTSEMIGNPAWGHQILEAIGPKWIEPTIPDVVNEELVPTVPPSQRWSKMFPGCCEEDLDEECAVVDMAKVLAEASCGKGPDSSDKETSHAGATGQIKHDTQPSDSHLTGSTENHGAATERIASSKSDESTAVGSGSSDGLKISCTGKGELASDSSKAETTS